MRPFLTIIFVFLCLGSVAFGQSYAINWYTIDGGGGTSSGGGYTLSGTIGQPDGGVMSGGSYTLNGGFWSVVGAIQTPGAPHLSVRLTGNRTVVVSWPAVAAGFTLQSNGTLNAGDWADEPMRPVRVGDEFQVTVSAPMGARYFRLRKP